jgi:uncharacterized membrane protein YhiD involved in acid resistance
MPELLGETVAKAAVALSPVEVALRLLASALLGFVVAGIYCGSQRRRTFDLLPFFTTLVLLTMLVAMTTVVIGDSVARAFGLVGALSIVRFRTVVEDTRDTAFVIFAVVVGMAVGAGHPLVALIGIPIVAATTLVLRFWDQSENALRRGGEHRLEVRMGSGYDPEKALEEVLKTHTTTCRLTAAVTARQGTALDVHYSIRLREPDRPLQVVKALNAVEGVQQVELKEP